MYYSRHIWANWVLFFGFCVFLLTRILSVFRNCCQKGKLDSLFFPGWLWYYIKPQYVLWSIQQTGYQYIGWFIVIFWKHCKGKNSFQGTILLFTPPNSGRLIRDKYHFKYLLFTFRVYILDIPELTMPWTSLLWFCCYYVFLLWF